MRKVVFALAWMVIGAKCWQALYEIGTIPESVDDGFDRPGDYG